MHIIPVWLQPSGTHTQTETLKLLTIFRYTLQSFIPKQFNQPRSHYLHTLQSGLGLSKEETPLKQRTSNKLRASIISSSHQCLNVGLRGEFLFIS